MTLIAIVLGTLTAGIGSVWLAAALSFGLLARILNATTQAATSKRPAATARKDIWLWLKAAPQSGSGDMAAKMATGANGSAAATTTIMIPVNASTLRLSHMGGMKLLSVSAMASNSANAG